MDDHHDLVLAIHYSTDISKELNLQKKMISDFLRFAKIQRSMGFQDLLESYKYVTDSSKHDRNLLFSK